jgi:hypothetical protein
MSVRNELVSSLYVVSIVFRYDEHDIPSNRWTICKSALNNKNVGRTDLSNELSRNTIRLDLFHQLLVLLEEWMGRRD